jgi:hypothetical protein
MQLAADQTSQSAVEPLINGPLEIKTLLDQWLKLLEVMSMSFRFETYLSLSKECKIHSQIAERPTDEHIFATAFQNVLHKGTHFESLLEMEFIYNSEIDRLIKQHDQQIHELELK